MSRCQRRRPTGGLDERRVRWYRNCVADSHGTFAIPMSQTICLMLEHSLSSALPAIAAQMTATRS